MTLHTIRMPDIGEGIAEVEIVKWHVAPGDLVAEDQTLCDVMTDKAAVEVPSSIAGRVVELGGEVGQVMAVGSALIRIEADVAAGSNAPSAPAATRGPAGEAAAPVPGPAAAAQPPGRAEPGWAPAGAAALVPERVPGSAPTSTSTSTSTSAPAPAAPAPAPARPAHPLAAPAVRARAHALGIDLGGLRGSGPEGRVVHADLDAARRAGLPAGAASEAVHEIELIGLRRKIAQKMQESKRQIPHYSYVEEVDVTELAALREALNAQHGASRGELSPLAFIVRAVVRALAGFPQINARFDDEAGVLSTYEAVHLGVATQTEAGLMVPVLRQAQTLDLWACSKEIARLAAAARSGKAVREELSGSTLTVTSLGKLGGIASTPVINRPEVAIVGVNRIVARPMVHAGAIAVRQMMNLSSSFDHRVVDGAQAAAYIQAVRRLLEHPALLFVE
ncbi:MAG: 2-oxo acid dehydrogenase subunit E2 [Burkholderiales bacterium]|nr:2-oxo acid dehydrogenase subunit E2 [Burkholderiales bacterium]